MCVLDIDVHGRSDFTVLYYSNSSLRSSQDHGSQERGERLWDSGGYGGGEFVGGILGGAEGVEEEGG